MSLYRKQVFVENKTSNKQKARQKLRFRILLLWTSIRSTNNWKRKEKQRKKDRTNLLRRTKSALGLIITSNREFIYTWRKLYVFLLNEPIAWERERKKERRSYMERTIRGKPQERPLRGWGCWNVCWPCSGVERLFLLRMICGFWGSVWALL